MVDAEHKDDGKRPTYTRLPETWDLRQGGRVKPVVIERAADEASECYMYPASHVNA
jgi:hypothetical protein